MGTLPFDNGAFAMALVVAIAFFVIYKTRKDYPVLNHMAPAIFLMFFLMPAFAAVIIPQTTTPLEYTTNDITGQTAGVLLCKIIPNTTGTFRLGGYVTITAVSVDVLQLQSGYTDENYNTQTQLFYPQGVTSANLQSTGSYVFPTMDVRASAGNALTINTVLTTGIGSIAYDAGCSITKIS